MVWVVPILFEIRDPLRSVIHLNVPNWVIISAFEYRKVSSLRCVAILLYDDSTEFDQEWTVILREIWTAIRIKAACLHSLTDVLCALAHGFGFGVIVHPLYELVFVQRGFRGARRFGGGLRGGRRWV